MLDFRKVAVTGGLASGKSSVLRFFEEFGATVVCADKIVHQLLDPTTPLGKQALSLLGKSVLVGGEFDRQRVAKRLFEDPLLLHRWERLLHPKVRDEIKTYFTFQQGHTPILLVVELPLLFEVGWEGDYDVTLAVFTPEEVAEARYLQSGGSQEEFRRRSQRQWTPAQKAEKADIVIKNDGTLEELRQKLQPIFEQLIAKD